MREETEKKINSVLKRHGTEFISISQISKESKVGFYAVVLFVASNGKKLTKIKAGGRMLYRLIDA